MAAPDPSAEPTTAPTPEQLARWRARLDTRFAQIDAVFEPLMHAAWATLSPSDFEAYLDAARTLGKLGRGVEPMLVFLEEWPAVVDALGGHAEGLADLMQAVARLQRSPNGGAIAPMLQTLAAVARRLGSTEGLRHYLELCVDLGERTSTSIHGRHVTYASPALPAFFESAPRALAAVSLAGLRRWVDEGVRSHRGHPQRLAEYFALDSADSRAVLQRGRHGTLFANVQRSLEVYLRALWDSSDPLVPIATGWSADEQPAVPHLESDGLRVPDVYEDLDGIRGIDRYRAALAHLMAHQRWSASLIADNWSPAQRLAVECFEDARVDHLLCRAQPGLRPLLAALHPAPRAADCDPETTSCLRHRLTRLSRALLDPSAEVDATLERWRARFQEALADGPSSTAAMAQLALAYIAETRRASDQLARVHFTDTIVSYRDDNRHLWRFIEEGDEEEVFDRTNRPRAEEEPDRLPPRLYPEWNESTQSYRPDWVSVYDQFHPSGNAAEVDRLLAKHADLARALKRWLDWLKPQDRVRQRFQEDGSELDLDIAVRAWVDLYSGQSPDPRVNFSHRTQSRDVAVLLLLDCSQSLNQAVAGSTQTLLQLAQESVALLGWAISELGDQLAIAGFCSNTRHDVRYSHILGFSETWGDIPKARLAALQASYSTRMGAAVRHAAHYLGARRAQKKLLLILTDGEPADVDVSDPEALIADARQAVRELDGSGIHCHAVSLDPQADRYAREIFGHHYTVIDRVEQLPERMPKLFMSLTR